MAARRAFVGPIEGFRMKTQLFVNFRFLEV